MSAAPEIARLPVRPMRLADLDDVQRIEAAAYPFPWSWRVFRDCLRVGYSCWVLERQGQLDGYGIMQIGAGECHLLNLCIAVPVQGRGLGRALLECLVGIAREHGARLFLLEVRPTNHIARRLYRSAGFREVGTRRGYYPDVDGREDAIILERVL